MKRALNAVATVVEYVPGAALILGGVGVIVGGVTGVLWL